MLCLILPQGLTVIRKELKATNPDHHDDFNHECRVLSYLNCLNHPNIVELLESYTYNSIHSLIFPVAEYDLRKLLQSPQHSEFKSESEYIFALCGLASALVKLHNFLLEDPYVRFTGCHHDLRPHNVLVKDGRLLLADFGHSNLKEVAEVSDNSWKRGDNRYLAPECEDPDNDFRPGRVWRKSDIWSLGCIIAEFITYMMEGPNGVRDFENSRKVTLAEKWIFYTFHAGRQPNKGLHAWLAKLKDGASPTGIGAIQLIHDMLQIKPDDRPSAQVVTQRLRLLALNSKFDAVDRALGLWPT